MASRIYILIIAFLLLASVAWCAVNDVTWDYGSAELYQTSGETVTVYWDYGSAFVAHEYAAEDAAYTQMMFIN